MKKKENYIEMSTPSSNYVDPYYLIHCDSISVLEFKRFVGVVMTLQELMPLLFDFHRSIILHHPNMTGSTLAYDIRVYKINHQDYSFLQKECDGKFENIDTGLVNANLLCLQNSNNKFDNEFNSRYFDILERSQLFI